MKEINIRKWHRRIGFTLGPMVIIQAVTGLTLSLPFIYDAQERVHSTLAGRKMPSLSKFWKFLLVDGHTGGGIFGIWYTLLLGCGLTFIALSGIFIFLRIRQRLRQSAEREAPSATTGGQAAVPDEFSIPDLLPERRKVMAFNWRAYMLLAVGLLLGSLVATYVNFLAYRIASRDTALSITVSEITLQALQAHLEQEEILDGSRKNGMERVKARMEKADLYSIALVQGGVTDLGVVPPPDDPALLDKFKSFRQVFLEFNKRVEERGVLSSKAAQDVGLVKAYDKTFAEFIVQAEDVKISVHESYLQNVYAFRSKFGLFLFLNAILVALTSIIIYRLERYRMTGSRRKASKEQGQ
jgi:hypothetical protein